jgi:hypothetical protein
MIRTISAHIEGMAGMVEVFHGFSQPFQAFTRTAPSK